MYKVPLSVLEKANKQLIKYEKNLQEVAIAWPTQKAKKDLADVSEARKNIEFYIKDK